MYKNIDDPPTHSLEVRYTISDGQPTQMMRFRLQRCSSPSLCQVGGGGVGHYKPYRFKGKTVSSYLYEWVVGSQCVGGGYRCVGGHCCHVNSQDLYQCVTVRFCPLLSNDLSPLQKELNCLW